jgi:hypothetical protein
VTPEVAAGWSARGRLNDASSVVLMLAMIPVALLVTTLETETVTTVVLPVAAVGIGAMLFVAGLQALLVARRVTYEQTKRWVLLGGAVIGLWYIATGLLAGHTALEGGLAWLAIGSGIGFIAIGYGFAAGNERHPLSALGGALLLGASTAFFVVIGTRLVTGDLIVPAWNA